MTSRVIMPQRKNFDAELFKEGGTIVGGVVGGIVGAKAGAPVQGAAGGALLGRGIGGMAGGLVAPDRPTPQVQRGGGIVSPERPQQPGLLDTAAGAAGAYEGVNNFGARYGGGPSASITDTHDIPQSSTPIQRRMESQHDSVKLAEADAALDQAPPEYQQRYGPAIKQARYLDMQRRGLA